VESNDRIYSKKRMPFNGLRILGNELDGVAVFSINGWTESTIDLDKNCTLYIELENTIGTPKLYSLLLFFHIKI